MKRYENNCKQIHKANIYISDACENTLWNGFTVLNFINYHTFVSIHTYYIYVTVLKNIGAIKYSRNLNVMN